MGWEVWGFLLSEVAQDSIQDPAQWLLCSLLDALSVGNLGKVCYMSVPKGSAGKNILGHGGMLVTSDTAIASLAVTPGPAWSHPS